MTTQLHETNVLNSTLKLKMKRMKNKLSLSNHNLLRVEKNYQMLTGDSNVVNNISLEQCDELILTLNRSEEKLLQRRVSYDMILIIDL